MNVFGSMQVAVGGATIVLGVLAVWALRGEPGKPIAACFVPAWALVGA
jgi:hypothetical protein